MTKEINITNEFPPQYIYNACVEKFGVSFRKGVIFTVGKNIHVFEKEKLTKDLIEHEITHVIQQMKMGVEKWWDKYLNDPEFRLEQEVEAYREQYKYALKAFDREDRRMFLNDISKHLSGYMYGNLVTQEEAKELIKNYDTSPQTERDSSIQS